MSRRLLLPLLAWKAALVGFALLSFFLLPQMFNVENFLGNFHWPPGQKVRLLTSLMTWDAQHFLFLSQHGYQRLPPEQAPFNAFYPLWPALIRLGSLALPPFAAALVLSNLLSLGGLIGFHALVAERHNDPALADRALLLLLAFPSAYVLCLPYSESLFLLLTVVLFGSLFAGRTRTAALCAFLLPLTRASGVFMSLPLLVHAFVEARRPRRAWLALLPLFGFAAYLAVMQLSTGDAFTGFKVYRHYVGRAGVEKVWDVSAFLRAFAPLGGLQPHGMTDSALDRCVFVAFLGSLPLVARLGPTWLAYALVAGVIPAAANGFMSYTRYALMLLPSFVAVAAWLGGRRAWLVVLAAASFLLQVALLLRHVNAQWAG